MRKTPLPIFFLAVITVIWLGFGTRRLHISDRGPEEPRESRKIEPLGPFHSAPAPHLPPSISVLDRTHRSHEVHNPPVDRNAQEKPFVPVKNHTGTVWSASTAAAHKAPRIVLFTTLKPAVAQTWNIQVNALSSWRIQSINPVIVIFGDEPGSDTVAKQVGARYEPQVKKSDKYNTVLLGPMFRRVAELFPEDTLFGFMNGDLVIPQPDLLEKLVSRAQQQFTEYFLTGARYTLPLSGAISFDANGAWASGLLQKARLAGAKHDRIDAEDYFIFTRNFFGKAELPAFHVGRPGYDNWLVNRAIGTGKPVVDCTQFFTVIHQQHSYGHIQSGNYHNSPERDENYAIALANGGWQKGSVDFAPWDFRGSPCSLFEGNSGCQLHRRHS
eukprot:TRINITY_DN7791_c0_g1_i1.p1 TRINITY_DN7791_c0_g1~~TRINITY_DN7791_c0_g1_i1.p1  ORF type:complete len:392 (+),score=52.97 TRINITY_DN7791_c0_g1_i1:22-1176(+)